MYKTSSAEAKVRRRSVNLSNRMDALKHPTSRAENTSVVNLRDLDATFGPPGFEKGPGRVSGLPGTLLVALFAVAWVPDMVEFVILDCDAQR
ncbi:MAG: hypothetical protein JO356_16955 [Acidobacteria bacterium]|nr:hypothetical protein [Acidobacteriota bacterium]